MTSVVSSPASHGFSSLVVNRTRPPSRQPFSPPVLNVMPPADVIVISDDEDIATEASKGKARAVQSHQWPEPEPSSRTRRVHDISPPLHRSSKRQRMEIPVDLTEDASSSGPRHVVKNEPVDFLDLDDDIFADTQLPLDFFGDAFSGGDYLNMLNTDSPAFALENPRPKKEAKPPYLQDAQLGIRMYCGPGFEHFPVPVINDPKHQEACDKWDEKQKRKEDRQRNRTVAYPQVLSAQAPESDSEEDENNIRLTNGENDCLARVLEVLPDVQRSLVVAKIRSQHESYDFDGEEIEILPDTGAIMAEILEMDAYPKEVSNVGQIAHPYENETGKTIKWDNKHRYNTEYLSDAMIVLARTFEHVPSHYIHKIVSEKGNTWDAYIHIENTESDYFQLAKRPYKRTTKPRESLEKKYQRAAPPEPHYYAAVVTELQAAKQHVAREFLRKNEEQHKKDAEIANLQRHKADGAILECQCCFDDEIPLNRAVSCTAVTNAHNFCYVCVENLANTQIGLMRHEMMCMDGSGCKAKLDMDGVGQAVPIKTYDRLLFNEQQAEIAAANIEGLEQCPFCDFKAICEPIEIDTTFSCQNPDCFRVTCRKCKETSHSPKTCEEVQKDRGLNAKHKIEEARSAAMLRPCPKCKTMIIKEGGCNKMRCQCGALMCYVCKKDLSEMKDGYSHFDGRAPVAGRQGTKCQLYDALGVDQRHITETNEAEKKAIQEAKDTDSTLHEEDLQIETGKAAKSTATPSSIPTPIHPALIHHHLPGGLIHPNDALARGNHDEVMNWVRERRATVARLNGRAGRARPGVLPVLNHLPQPAPAVAGADLNQGGPPWIPQFRPPQLAPGMLPVENQREAQRANIERLQNELEQYIALPAVPFNQLDGIYDEPMDLDVPLDLNRDFDQNAREIENLITGRRIHNHRAELDRRRRSQVQRRNSGREADNRAATYPNPAILHIRQPTTPLDTQVQRKPVPTVQVPAEARQPPQPQLQTPTNLTFGQPAQLGQQPQARTPVPTSPGPVPLRFPELRPWNAVNPRPFHPGPQNLPRGTPWRDRPLVGGATNGTNPNVNTNANSADPVNNEVANLINRRHPLRSQTIPAPYNRVPNPIATQTAANDNNLVDVARRGNQNQNQNNTRGVERQQARPTFNAFGYDMV